MSTYTTVPAPVEIIVPGDTVEQLRGQIKELVARLHSALDEIAEAAGAEKCPSCGEWTAEPLVDIETVDDYGVSWGTEYYCTKCEPGR